MDNIQSDYVPVIGLEVHVQLNTKTKLFCSCPNESLGKVNTRLCPVCLGHPGTLPVPNQTALRLAAKLGNALGSKVNQTIQFARKNYFYPDLPKGYQTSQFSSPVCEGGSLSFSFDESIRTIRLHHAHLEEDAGKLTHFNEKQFTGVDLNRCGAPLLEIVSEPDISSPEEARTFLTFLKRTLEFLEISECDMEKGQLRCDANISIRKPNENKLNTRTEIKNLNSFKFVEKALNKEFKRQVEIKKNQDDVIQCTLNYNEKSDSLTIIRVKEDAHDYRYFPDPDQLPVIIENYTELETTKTETPFKRMKRYIHQLNLSYREADRLCQTKDISDFFEACLKKLNEPKLLYNWISGDLSKNMNKINKSFADMDDKLSEFCELLSIIQSEKLTGKLGKNALESMICDNQKLSSILKKEQFQIQSGTDDIKKILEQILNDNPTEFTRFTNGEQKLRGFFIGKVMQKTNGAANPKTINQLLDEIQAAAD